MGKEPKTFTNQNGGGALGIVDMHGKSGTAIRSGEERITEMDIYFRHQERRQNFDELGGDLAQLHHHQFRDAEGDIVVAEQFFYSFRIAYYDSGDGGIG